LDLPRPLDCGPSDFRNEPVLPPFESFPFKMNPTPEMNHAGARLAPHSNFFFSGKIKRHTQIPDMNNKMTKNVFLFSYPFFSSLWK
jgi:hypothetical protein